MSWTTVWINLQSFYTTLKMPVDIVAIIVIAIILRAVFRFVIERVVNRIVTGVKKRQNVDDTQALATSPLSAVRIVQRTRTLGSVLNNIVAVVLVIVSALLIITAIDKNILGSFALITAALGAGLGFGAQNIVKDVLNGLFMVAEDQLGMIFEHDMHSLGVQFDTPTLEGGPPTGRSAICSRPIRLSWRWRWHWYLPAGTAVWARWVQRSGWSRVSCMYRCTCFMCRSCAAWRGSLRFLHWSQC